MRATLMIAGIVAVAAAFSSVPNVSAEEVRDLSTPKPEWLTPELEAKIKAAGTKGYDVRVARGGGADENAGVQPDCLGTAPPYAGADGVSVTAVSAATCMVSPTAAR